MGAYQPTWTLCHPANVGADGAFLKKGLALVTEKHKWGFINRAGRLTIPLEFQEARDFCQGRAAVKVKGRWGFIDKKGRIVIACQFDDVTDFTAGSATVWSGKKGRAWLILTDVS